MSNLCAHMTLTRIPSQWDPIRSYLLSFGCFPGTPSGFEERTGSFDSKAELWHVDIEVDNEVVEIGLHELDIVCNRLVRLRFSTGKEVSLSLLALSDT